MELCTAQGICACFCPPASFYVCAELECSVTWNEIDFVFDRATLNAQMLMLMCTSQVYIFFHFYQLVLAVQCKWPSLPSIIIESTALYFFFNFHAAIALQGNIFHSHVCPLLAPLHVGRDQLYLPCVLHVTLAPHTVPSSWRRSEHTHWTIKILRHFSVMIFDSINLDTISPLLVLWSKKTMINLY